MLTYQVPTKPDLIVDPLLDCFRSSDNASRQAACYVLRNLNQNAILNKDETYLNDAYISAVVQAGAGSKVADEDYIGMIRDILAERSLEVVFGDIGTRFISWAIATVKINEKGANALGKPQRTRNIDETLRLLKELAAKVGKLEE